MSHFGGVKVVLERALRRAKDWDMVGGGGRLERTPAPPVGAARLGRSGRQGMVLFTA